MRQYLKVLIILVFTNLVSTQLYASNDEFDGILNDTMYKHNLDFLPGKTGTILLEHVLDDHDFRIASIDDRIIALPLPIILYTPQKGGLTCFMSSHFGHGMHRYNGYRLVDEVYLEHLQKQREKNVLAYRANMINSGSAVTSATTPALNIDTTTPLPAVGKIIAVDANDHPIKGVQVYDFSITRNVAQMFICTILLVWVILTVGARYRKGVGVKTAPKGIQNLLEPIIIFVRDEVGIAYLGDKHVKYMPYLLTVFFFILINNLVGLIPSSANVTGNIAFTVVLGVISFLVTTFNAGKYYWAHLFNPSGVPLGIKFILIPVEILGVFTKPFALIIRLFANMIAGHMIITCLIMLIFIFGYIKIAVGFGFAPISVAFVVFIYFIEILVAFIQAYIFTNLTAVFIGQAIEEPQHHLEHHH
ncbi:MAG: F0F1 ATP synthase subunit A [Phycisphaerales bacterium]|nr:F0F1 ATP synthase subunit A [Phycisphaerales bacterium]